MVIECALSHPDVREDIDALDAHYGGGGTAEAIALSFFSGSVSPNDIGGVADDSLIGYAILINYRSSSSSSFEHSYIYESILSPPFQMDGAGQRRSLLNNYICSKADFKRSVKGREFALSGFYYCQQNNTTHVCAHACLRMAINTLDTSKPPLTNCGINDQLNLTPPLSGLSLGQIVDVIKARTGNQPMIADCSGLSKQDYLSILCSYIESGFTVLLVFTTANHMEHVVTVFGHTRNSDEWHPQAIPGYSGATSAPFYPSSAWVDHFIIHDDNLGPYYTLSSRALEVDPTITPHWIVGIHPQFAAVSPHYAETLSAIVLASALPGLGSLGTGQWFEYITKSLRRFVMRAILMDRDRYRDHLVTSVAHDGSKLLDAECNVITKLPSNFWMVEYTLPALFTGNRTKLGEVIIEASGTNPGGPMDIVSGLRLPSLFLLRDAGGNFALNPMSIGSHSPLYMWRDHDNQW